MIVGLVLGALAPVARAETPSPPSSTDAKRSEPFLSHEPYLTSGFGYYGSDRRVVAGLGGGPGYRLNLGRHFATYVEGRWLVYTGNAFTGALGVMYRFRYQSWEPIFGLQMAAYAGNRIDVISSVAPQLAPPLALAAQARVCVLRFVEEPFTVSTLSLDWGYGADAGTRATAISVSLIDIGFRL